MRAQPRRRRGSAVLAAALVLLVGACSSGDSGDRSDGAERDGGAASTTAPDPSRSAASSPFAVAVPEGYELVSAGVGQQRQIWGEDCCGTTEPFTVLERADGEGGPVRVSIAGYEGMEGGFFQTLNGYGSSDGTPDGELLEIDGKRAAWYPGDPDPEGQGRWGWPELGVDEGDDLAVSVSGPGLTKDEAEAVYAAVELDGTHAHPPAVPSPPDGFAVVGAVDADGVLALGFPGEPDPESLPGSAETHSAGWVEGSRSLTVRTAPGRSLPLEAAAADEDDGASELRTVDGQPVLVSDSGEGFDSRQITVGVEAPWGDVVLVTAFTDQARSKDPVSLPPVEELIALARSVQQSTPAEWDAFVATVPG